MREPKIFLSYSSRDKEARSLKLFKALRERDALQQELNKVANTTRSLRQWLSDIENEREIDLSSLLSNSSYIIGSRSLAPKVNDIQDYWHSNQGLNDFVFPSQFLPHEANSYLDSIGIPQPENHRINNFQTNFEVDKFSYRLFTPNVNSLGANSYISSASDPGVDVVFPSERFSGFKVDNYSDKSGSPIIEDYWISSYFKAAVISSEIISEGNLFSDGKVKSIPQHVYLYLESSHHEQKLRRGFKMARKGVRSLKEINHNNEGGGHSVNRVFQKLQSIRINDKSGDEFNNLEKNQISRLLIFKN